NERKTNDKKKSSVQKHPVVTDLKLVKLLANQREVSIDFMCEQVTVNALLSIWEDLLEDKFDSLSLFVKESVVDGLFDLVLYEDENYSPDDNELSQFKVYGRVDKSKRYEISRNPRIMTYLKMCRIYETRRSSRRRC
ncbi:hypothetical protein PFISCL1PPCAC_21856, partial [Pristionchus fissidentatus]